MESTLPPPDKLINLLPISEKPFQFTLESPYIHPNEKHTNENTNKCTLCWKYFCLKCGLGTNRFSLQCFHCNSM